MEDDARGPGWDAQAIHEIARGRYGSLAALFEFNRWPERGTDMMPAVQRHVVRAYGTIANFKRAHDQAAFLCPRDTITQEEPNVWLKGLYFFAPDREGFLSFGQESDRRKFIKRTKPGVLVIIYGTSTASFPKDRGRILGILQLSHKTGHAEWFMSKDRKLEKEKRQETAKWPYAVEAVRAWKAPTDAQVPVKSFADVTYPLFRNRNISRIGELLTPEEALKILELNLYEVSVCGQCEIGFSPFGAAIDVLTLTPSRPGLVSQSPYMVREAEGPKHLYILKLEGRTHDFLGKCAHGRIIVKVGFSASPKRRCYDFNRTLPKGAFRWTIYKSTAEKGRDPFPSSGPALAGEKAMKDSGIIAQFTRPPLDCGAPALCGRRRVVTSPSSSLPDEARKGLDHPILLDDRV